MKNRIMYFMLTMALTFSAVNVTALAAEGGSRAKQNLLAESISENTSDENVLLPEESVSGGNGVTQEGEKEAAPAVTAVILSVHEGELRIRTWLDTMESCKVEADITCTRADGSVVKMSHQLEGAGNYYTSHLFTDSNAVKVRVVVSAVNEWGKTGYKAAEIFPENSSLEEERVVNDLWIRYLDGEGKEGNEYTYTGKAVKPQVEIYEGAVLLKEKKDYTLTYKNNKNAGTATILVRGKGNYGQMTESYFTILPKNLEDEDVVVDDFSSRSNGKRQEKVPKITYNKKKLSNKNNKDFTIIYEDESAGAYQEPGNYQVRIVGNGNFTGELVTDFSIGPKLVKNLKVSAIAPRKYTGQPVSINDLVIKDGKNMINPEQFTIRYENNVDAGTAEVILQGNGTDYAGSKRVKFTITGIPLKNVISDKSMLPGDVIYNGKEQTPGLQLTYENEKLKEGTDYLVEYKNNIEAGKASMVITGKGKFTGEIKHTFKILPYDAAKDDKNSLTVTFEGEGEQGALSLPFCKSGVKPTEEVRFNGTLLKPEEDYTVSYQKNKAVTADKAQGAKVILKMKGNFSKTIEKDFGIYPQSLEAVDIVVQDVVASQKKFAWKSKVTITDLDGKKLAAGKDYEKAVEYFTDEECINPAAEEVYPTDTLLWVKIKGAGNYAGSEAVVPFSVKDATIVKAKVKIKDQAFTGRPVTISTNDIVSVNVGGKSLTPGEDFEILSDSYRNNVQKGKAKVSLKGKNEYGGTLSTTFAIVQKDFHFREELEDNQQASLYTVSLNNTSVNEFAEKGEAIILTAKIWAEPEGNITYIKVNGKNINVIKLQDNLFTAELAGSISAGNLPIEVTAVGVDGEECSVNWIGSSEVLKDIPSVEPKGWSETENGALEYSFFVKDEDQALLEASKAVITKEGQEINSQPVKAGENKISLPAGEEGQYKISIQLSYDRDSKRENGKNEVRNEEVYTTSKTVGGVTYSVSLQDTKVSEYIEKNEKITLTTKIAVEPEGSVTALRINGKEYAVTKAEDDTYTVLLDGAAAAGSIPVEITMAIMNGEEYGVSWSGSSEVLKDIPSVEPRGWTEPAGGIPEYSFFVKDEDQALLEDSQVVITKEGQEIGSQLVKAGENKISLTSGEEGQYKISIQLSYDRDNQNNNGKNEVKKEEVYSTLKTISSITYHVSLQDTQVSEYAERNENIILTTKVVTEPEGNVTSLRVNGKDYALEKAENGLYTVEIAGSKQAGNLPVEVTSVTMNGEEYTVNWKGNSEVLKDIPAVTNTSWSKKETGETEFIFTVKDDDKSLSEESYVLILKGQETVVRQKVTAGENKVSFTGEAGNEYKVSIQLSYDRDTNASNGKNETLNKEVYTDSTVISEITYKVNLQNTKVTEYVEKNNKITLTTGIATEPEGSITSIKVNGVKYDAAKNQSGEYTIEIPGSTTAGSVLVEVTSITVNGAEYDVSWKGSSEVLKDVPVAINPVWTEENEKLKFSVTVQDPDGALQSDSAIVVTKSDEEIATKTIQAGENSVEFTPEDDSTYDVSVQVSYDRDTNPDNGKNHVKNQEVHQSSKYVPAKEAEEEEELVAEPLELKNITSVTLYLQGEEVQGLDISKGAPENPKDYMVKIESNTARDLYVEVEDLVVEDNKLRVVPNLTGFVHYEAENDQMTEKENILLYADNVVQGNASSGELGSIQELVNALNAGQNYTLTKDLDASSITTGYICSYYEGTLDGNGHTIYNLNVPMFEDIYKATIKNLTIKNAHIEGNTGILTKSIYTAKVENVKIIDSEINSPNLDTVGGMAGQIVQGGEIKNSSIENVKIKAAHTIGGVVGKSDNNKNMIQNVSVTGYLEGTRQGNEGAMIGGIAGTHTAGTIDKCYSQVTIQAPSQTGNGGIIGGPSNATSGSITNSLSYAQGMCYGIAGFNNKLGTINNVSQMAVQGVGQNTASGITTINEITKNTMTTLGLSDRAWELYEAAGKENSHASDLSQIEGYDSSRTKGYENLGKLAFAQNSESLVKEGNTLTDEALLQKEIKQIYPVDQQGEYVAGVVLGEEKNLTKILVEFTDGSRKEISLTYVDTIDNLVAVYYSKDLGITYHYDKYVSTIDTSFKEELLNIVKAYTYDGNLDSLTSQMADRRQYKDYYKDVTSKNLEKFIDLQLISQEKYPFYLKDDDMLTKLKESLKTELPKLLYTYNYINKWYDFDIGSLNPAKILFFDSEKLGESLTQEILVQSVTGGDSSNTEQTATFFEKYIQPRTKEGLYDVLENLMNVAGYEDPNEWFKENFKGILKEQNVIGVSDTEGIRYRIWDNLRMLSGNNSLLLPILTAPQEDMILVSAPTQVFLSSINRYYGQNTEQTRKLMEAAIDTFCQWTGTYFGSIVNIVPGAREAMKTKMVCNFDTRFNYKHSGSYAGTQVPEQSEEPVFKWVNEAVRKWGMETTGAAYANGNDIHYINDLVLFGTELGFRTFTHENAHVQEDSLFYMGNGRRGGNTTLYEEFHADGVLAQEFADGTMTFNLSRELDYKEAVVVNLSPERINSAEKLEDYYKDMFEVSYVLDYLVAKAFLELTEAEQSKVAMQAVEYPGSQMELAYAKVSEEKIQEMDLQSVEDLITNKLSIISKENSGLLAGYYIESFWNIKWYQPHNDQGISDEASFKGFSHEMLGYAGYEDGFVEWLSKKHSNDVAALRQITNNANNTFENYKKSRFDQVEAKLNQIPWFDTKDVIDQFVEALKTDGDLTWPRHTTELKKIYYHTIKRATNDFSDGNIYELPKAGTVSSTEELVAVLESGVPAYIKLTNHIDLSQIASDKGYYFENFSGVFDGNGYEIYGLKAPLFNQVTFGSFRNMNMDVSLLGQNGAMLSKNSQNVLVNGINYDKSKNVTLITSTPAGYIYKTYNIIKDGVVYVSPRNKQ